MGILDMLDEQCRFPTATHKDLAEKLYGSGVCQGSARFKRPKLSQTAFTVEHYAGEWVGGVGVGGLGGSGFCYGWLCRWCGAVVVGLGVSTPESPAPPTPHYPPHPAPTRTH